MVFPDTLTGRFATLMARVCVLIAYRTQRPWEFRDQPPVSRAVLLAAEARVAVVWRLFNHLADRVRLGTFRVYPDRASPRRSAAPLPAQPDGEPPAARVCLPRGFGWLLRVMTRWPHGPMLDAFLADPEVAALIPRAPGFARLLRPLCRAFGVTPPPGLFPTPARRPRPAARTCDARTRDARTRDARRRAERARTEMQRARQPARAASPADILATPQERERAWASRPRHPAPGGAAEGRVVAPSAAGRRKNTP